MVARIIKWLTPLKISIGLICCLHLGLRLDAAIATTAQRDSLARVYTSQLGVAEATGRNDGPQVEAYQRVTGNRRGDAWCASFVAWCYKQVGVKRVGNGAAASWFKQPIYVRNTHGIRRFSQLAAKRGNTGSLFYQKLGRIGHIFFIDDVRGEWVITVEGNTNNGQSREGDGVYKLRRRIRNIYSVSTAL